MCRNASRCRRTALYVRNKITAATPVVHETLTTEQRIARLRANLDTFVARVLRPV